MRKFYKSTLTFLLCCKHRDLPWQFWFFIVLIPVYVISPIDIIPDGVKYIGYFDDIIVGFILFMIAYHRIEDITWYQCRDTAEEYMEQGLKKSWPAILAIFIMLVALLFMMYEMYFIS